ncbi:ABC transporter ATP-binding protein [Myxococcota bacterium]|nr:ABC transporter ATP-binding protein [Myxococcota bacterium]
MIAHLELEGAEKVYGTAVRTYALKATTLTIPRGELVVILGPSGSGKTTLLNLVGGLDRPSAGRVAVGGQDLQGLSDDALCAYRREKVGFVFQFFNLIPSLTAWENVAFAAELTGGTEGVDGLLGAVGLGDLGDRFPSELSGGQQQRVAIARALAKRPELLLCDEPTGALDEESGRQVLGLLESAARDGGRTVLVVTHNPTFAAMADRVIRLRDGGVVGVERNDAPQAAHAVAW